MQDTPPKTNIAASWLENGGPRIESMYGSLKKIGIFQPAMLDYRSVLLMIQNSGKNSPVEGQVV